MSQKLGIISGGGSIAAQVASYFSASGGEVFIVAIDGAGYDDDRDNSHWCQRYLTTELL